MARTLAARSQHKEDVRIVAPFTRLGGRLNPLALVVASGSALLVAAIAVALKVRPFRRELDEGMWAAVPTRDPDTGQREAQMVQEYTQIPPRPSE